MFTCIRIKQMAGGIIILICTLLLQGCLYNQIQTKPTKEAYALNRNPYRSDNPKPKVYKDGSLWQDQSSFSDLFIDARARDIGDIVTVRILESTTAKNSADTDTSRKSSILGALDALFGYEQKYQKGSKYFKKSGSPFNPFSEVKAELDSQFKGAGSTTRSGDLEAYITARVTDVLPNGNLRITGNRELEVNHEIQMITLAGIIRPRDIDSDNVILSTYIADATISISGSGVINDRQKTGWLMRTMDHVWPF